MSKLDGNSRELYEGEKAAFLASQKRPTKRQFRIERRVERRFSSGHKIVYRAVTSHDPDVGY